MLNITIDDIINNNNIKWNWDFISENNNLTPEFILDQKFKDKINYNILFFNPLTKWKNQYIKNNLYFLLNNLFKNILNYDIINYIIDKFIL